MKAPPKASALHELNIGSALETRCVTGNVKVCGTCEGCVLGERLNKTKEWFERCGEIAKRTFVLGIIRRFDSMDLYEYIASLLQLFNYKDFIYARSRSKPSLPGDGSSAPTNHALEENTLGDVFSEIWNWFSSSAYWTKANYMLGLMRLCDAHLLYIMAVQTKTLLGSEKYRVKTTKTKDLPKVADQAKTDGSDDLSNLQDESLQSSISSSQYTLQTYLNHSYAPLPLSPDSAFSPSPDIRNQLSSILTDDIKTPSPFFRSTSSKRKPKIQAETIPEFVEDEQSPPKQTPCSKVRKHSEATSGNISIATESVKSKSANSRKGSYSSQFSSTRSGCHRTTSGGSKYSSGQQSYRGSTSSKISVHGGRTCRHVDQDDDYLSADDFDDEFLDLTIDPTVLVVASPSLCYAGLQKHKDFIRHLPVHISKYILGLLDEGTLTNCLCVSAHWRMLAEEVKKEFIQYQIMTEEVMLMQGTSAKGAMNSRYAKRIPVHIPKYLQETVQEKDCDLHEHCNHLVEFEDRDMRDSYPGIPTKQILLEERNIYCGPYNVLVLQDQEDHHRCVMFSGGKYVVLGSNDRRVKLINCEESSMERQILGHAGSIKCVHVSEERGIVLSGSFDTSIRCWDLKMGNCKTIFRGHRATVICMSLHGNNLASGAKDKSVKVWNFTTGKCRRTFRHRHIVQAVHVSDELVVSGCEGGKVKVWDIEKASLIKTLDGHQNAITCLKFDKYHIVTGSLDYYAMAWSTVGKHKRCVQAFRHPKEVLCLDFLYCRVVTGSADGKMRIWNLLNGDCLRVIRGNSKNSPINAVFAAEDRLVVNTLTNLLIYNFEIVTWDYSAPPERPEPLGINRIYSKFSPKKLPHSYVRAQRLSRQPTQESIPSRISVSRINSAVPVRDSTVVHPVPSKKRVLAGVEEDDIERITSAPGRLRQQDSTLSSVSTHIERIRSATKVMNTRPLSSPPKYSLQKSYETKVNTGISLHSSTLRSLPKEETLPNCYKPYILTRSRSAPAQRAQTLPLDKRGWTSSVAKPVYPIHNKLMMSTKQSKEALAQRRPQSAHYKNTISRMVENPLKSFSALNLKTYSEQLKYEETLRHDRDLSNRNKGGS